MLSLADRTIRMLKQKSTKNMNSHRVKPGPWVLRDGHYDEIDMNKMTNLIIDLQDVSEKTCAPLEQVIAAYNAATRNRFIEVLLDYGDAFDKVVDDIMEWKRSDKALRLMLSRDSMADEVRVEVNSKN